MATDLRPFDSNDKLVVFLPSQRDEAWIERFQARYPGAEIKWINGLRDDGSFIWPNETDPRDWDGATIISTVFPPPDGANLDKLRFVQLASAGADVWLKHDLYHKKHIIFSTSNGIHA